MKRIFLTLFFAAYYFFMPFVMVNCSVVDQPFAPPTDVSASESENQYTLDKCQKMEFLVEACIDILQAEEERVQAEKDSVISASAELEDFTLCQSEADVSAAQADESAEELDCETTISNIISAFQICDGLAPVRKYQDCGDIEDAVNSASASCDEGSADVSVDFCSTLTA